ncbi:hypothetical protein COLO4_29677 [Corchorus olitorius]|uniref:Uncharacterized protein n=1 Tax=Corchorus olitorius TaxID=93759 RepID=A0A1R3HDM2_9ROSI|nr:hypothetical protein COLO4_29677 [Corchorus olitorius]
MAIFHIFPVKTLSIAVVRAKTGTQSTTTSRRLPFMTVQEESADGDKQRKATVVICFGFPY